MYQSQGADPRFEQGQKYGGYEEKQYNRHEHHNPIQNGKLLDKDEVNKSYQLPKQYGTSDGGNQEDFDMQDAVT